jgi:hypothetical protein
MRFIALIAWFTTALGGLYMLAVWLIENDATKQRNSASRLPLPVIVAHVTLAITGLCVWVAYLLFDRDSLAWTALCILGGIALLGFTMFARWIPVYRTTGAEAEQARVSARAAAPLGAPAEPVPAALSMYGTPPEGNFPLVVVVAHGTLAVSTVVLVLLTALGVGGS